METPFTSAHLIFVVIPIQLIFLKRSGKETEEVFGDARLV